MRAWFNTLTTRERAIVVAGGLVAGLVLVYLLVVEPVAERFQAQRQRVEALEGDLAWMTRAASEVIELRNAGHVGSPADTGEAPYLAFDAALRGAGLPQPEQLEPAGPDGARADFEAVPFAPLLSVLRELRRENGLRVTRARFTAVDAGMVSARLTLERAGR